MQVILMINITTGTFFSIYNILVDLQDIGWLKNMLNVIYNFISLRCILETQLERGFSGQVH